MKILIVGANFNNKGAQAMLFTLVNEIKIRNNSAEIYFASNENLDTSDFTFKHIVYNRENKDYVLKGKKRRIKIKKAIKDLIKIGLGRTTIQNFQQNWASFKVLGDLIPKIDLVLDISGYNIGEKWDNPTQVEYLKNIKIAKQFNIPIVLFPQSFGPFNYSEDRSWLLEEIKNTLKYCKKIYAREKTGLEALNNMGVQDVSWSPDMVLQSDKISDKNVFQNPQKSKEIVVDPDSVAIIPNFQCFNYGESNQIIELYKEIIPELLRDNKYVYIIRHSNDDLTACRMIKELFPQEKRVVLVSEDLNCIEYESLVNSFKYIICSRYHGIVHAYKQGIPAIVLGWEEKYQMLCDLMSQSQFNFDIAGEKIDNKEILKAVKEMNADYSTNSEKIKESLKRIKDYNCYKILDEVLKNKA